MVSADRRVPTYVHIALNNLPQLSTVNDVAARTSAHDQADAAGVGKTTLAHVAARHCGYRVVEINASDERSRGALLSAVAAAVQMQPVLGDRRPNCLVIDEIDGALGGTAGRAGGGAVAAIAEILRTGRVSVRDAEGGSGGGQGKGKGGSVPLLRPVICICNDLYTPALRPLREVAEVLEVGPPEDRMLRARLREVCRRERANVQEDVRLLTLPAPGHRGTFLQMLLLRQTREYSPRVTESRLWKDGSFGSVCMSAVTLLQ